MVYIFGTLTLSVLFSSLFKPGSVLNNNIHAKILALVTMLIVLWRITFRDITSDTLNYVNRFRSLSGISLQHTFNRYSDDRMFLFVTWVCSRITHNPQVFLFIMGLLFLLLFSKSLSKLFNPWQLSFVLFSYALYPFFYSYATNIMRQGLANALLLIAVAYYINDERKWRKTIIALVLACLFHWSAVPFAFLLLLMKKINFSLKVSLSFWVTASILFLSGLQQKLIAPLSPYIPRFDLYERFPGVGENLTGNRFDFFAFGALFVIAGLVLYKVYCKDPRYLKLVNTYILFNTVFLAMGFLAYSDRVAIYSWILIPVLVWLPVFNRKKYRNAHSFLILAVFSLIGVITGIYTKLLVF